MDPTAHTVSKSLYIDELQREWSLSGHKINNSNYQERSSQETLEATRNGRIRDLLNLLKIIHSFMKENTDLFRSGPSNTTHAFDKYVFNHVVVPFPNYSVDMFAVLKQDPALDEAFRSWIVGLENPKKRVKWVPLCTPYPAILDDHSSMDVFYAVKYRRFLLLAKICHFLDDLQVNDYGACNVLIDSQGRFEKGVLDQLKYGQYHALSAYLGQHIVRCFPFKDFHGFKSSLCAENQCNTTGKHPTIYEHYTPMSFFRDLIWYKRKGSAQALEAPIFDWKDCPQAYSERQWLEILWYRYRTITICTCEDDLLNKAGFRSRRPEGNVAYEKVGIQISAAQKSLWDQIHDVENIPTLP
jgi:hypothetical protein